MCALTTEMVIVAMQAIDLRAESMLWSSRHDGIDANCKSSFNICPKLEASVELEASVGAYCLPSLHPSCVRVMPSYNTTADWCVAQLRKEGWVSRNIMVKRLQTSRPRVYEGIVLRMSPDELLAGEGSGVHSAPDSVIILKDIPHHMSFLRLSIASPIMTLGR